MRRIRLPLFFSAAFFVACCTAASDIEITPWPNSSNPLYVFNVTGKYPSTGQPYTAHVAFLDEVSLFSILPQPQGCGNGRTNTSVSARHYGCQYATNGGFFDMANGGCLGNIISNGFNPIYSGTVINQANLSGAQFGVSESNRTVVAGYIENADFHSLGLSQLIQGLGWLVRDGKSYINQSAQIEKISSASLYEEAPRTILGVLPNGTLVFAQIDGEEDIKRGANYFELTEFMLSLKVRDAVNIDGGGSSVSVYNGMVISKPTCEDTPLICERAVSTITCAHYPNM